MVLTSAESAVKEAQEVASAVLGKQATAASDSEDERLVPEPFSSLESSGVSEEDLRPLESMAKRARVAGSTAQQVRQERRGDDTVVSRGWFYSAGGGNACDLSGKGGVLRRPFLFGVRGGVALGSSGLWMS